MLPNFDHCLLCQLQVVAGVDEHFRVVFVGGVQHDLEQFREGEILGTLRGSLLAV